MDSIVLYNQNGQKFNVNVTRYFEREGNKYFIFNLNEIDANGYIQLYASKVIDNNGQNVIINISDQDEWNKFKSYIESIASNNRNGIENTGDLDFNELNELVVKEFRVFKIKEEFGKILGENKNVKVPEPVIEKPIIENTIKPEPVDLQAASAQDTGLTIEEILKKVSEGAKNAKEELKINLNKEDSSINTPAIDETNASEKINETPRVRTIDELLNSVNVEPTNEFQNPVPISNITIDELPETEDEENVSTEITEETIDYRAKYEENEKIIERLEKENIRLINELIDAKAKLATVKDIIG